MLADAVRSHLVSDVPLGAFLSGGIDSSLVVGLMAEASGARVKTFSIGFDEPAFDELEHARRVAAALRHRSPRVRRQAGRASASSIGSSSHFDEPFADSSAIPTWYVSEMARRHVTVVLSGDGGDELFGGYDRYLPHPRVVAFDRYSPRGAAARRGDRRPRGCRTARAARTSCATSAATTQGRYLDAIRFFGADEKPALLTADVRRAARRAGSRDARWRGISSASPHLPWPSQMMRFDAETYLPEDVLTKVDRMSMAHSIESRVPLLDNEVDRRSPRRCRRR